MLSEIKVDRQKIVVLLAVWTAYGLFFGTQSYVRDLYSGGQASLPSYVAVWICCGYSWAVLTFPVLVFARRFSLEKLKWPRFLLVHFGSAPVFASVQLGIYVLIAGVLFSRPNRSLWDNYEFLLASELQWSVLVYGAIIAVITTYDRLFTKDFEPLSRDNGRTHTTQATGQPRSTGTNGFLRRISVKENGKIVLVDADRINWIESYGNYLFLYTPERKFIYRETMAAMERKLNPEQFVRIRRSTIVKVDQIKELHPSDNGEFEIVLVSGNILCSTRRYRKNLERVLKS
jgi:hypothetical protein